MQESTACRICLLPRSLSLGRLPLTTIPYLVIALQLGSWDVLQQRVVYGGRKAEKRPCNSDEACRASCLTATVTAKRSRSFLGLDNNELVTSTEIASYNILYSIDGWLDSNGVDSPRL
jgi:hypothetical protein